ncbi:hypothetical protein Droror1_Dr00023451 [Drosera rotundifolia]
MIYMYKNTKKGYPYIVIAYLYETTYTYDTSRDWHVQSRISQSHLFLKISQDRKNSEEKCSGFNNSSSGDIYFVKHHTKLLDHNDDESFTLLHASYAMKLCIQSPSF